MHTEFSSSQDARGMNIPGLQDPVHSSAEVFRVLAKVMSEPGTVEELTEICGHPDELLKAASAAILTLADMDTSLYLSSELDSPISRGFLTLHTGVKIVDSANQADFVIATQDTDISQYQDLPVGDPQYPDQSATLIIQVSNIRGSKKVTLNGPGIENIKQVQMPDLPDSFFSWRDMKNSLYPCGIDIIFASNTELMAIPRTTKLED
ncbi:phosphonate C-P lyase system protein PhnH [Curvivirga sp.]|uniref:phosphonate C-P lyase system protein PhnH n=1 Tax=Curvivirga sp. TaxID=2856848 RepID=UPI003B5A3A26